MSQRGENILTYLLGGLIMLALIIFSRAKSNTRTVGDVSVSIEQWDGNFFTSEPEVMSLITLGGSDYLIGSFLKDLNFKMLEKRVEESPFIEDAQVYRDLEGNLRVQVMQSKPIARLLIDNKQDKYIDEKGNIIPISTKHTARVPLIETKGTFKWGKNLHESRYGVELFELLRFIESDKFWNAQVAHIIIEQDGEVLLFPQVTKQRIEFGRPNKLREKFNKLMIFYKKILPSKGWNSYSKVNIKFEKQIICE